MMLHLVLVDEPRGNLGAINVNEMPEIGAHVWVRTDDKMVKLEVLETGINSEQLSPLFSDEMNWAQCRRV